MTIKIHNYIIIHTLNYTNGNFPTQDLQSIFLSQTFFMVWRVRVFEQMKEKEVLIQKITRPISSRKSNDP